jgi:hypothetical protein
MIIATPSPESIKSTTKRTQKAHEKQNKNKTKTTATTTTSQQVSHATYRVLLTTVN